MSSVDNNPFCKVSVYVIIGHFFGCLLLTIIYYFILEVFYTSH